MSPDSDAVQWIVVFATLVQTVATVVQARQSGAARPAMAVTLPFKLGLLASVISVLWVAAFNYVYERSDVIDGVYVFRDGLEDATPLKYFLFLGDVSIPILGCAAIVALVKTLVVARLDMSATLVHVVTLVACAVGLFVAVGQMYASGSEVAWLALALGALGGFQVEVEKQPRE